VRTPALEVFDAAGTLVEDALLPEALPEVFEADEAALDAAEDAEDTAEDAAEEADEAAEVSAGAPPPTAMALSLKACAVCSPERSGLTARTMPAPQSPGADE
jgi:hypothetical protein